MLELGLLGGLCALCWLVEKRVWEFSVGENLEDIVSVEIEHKRRLLDLGRHEECYDDKEVICAHRAFPVPVEKFEELGDLPVAQVCDPPQDHHEHVLFEAAPSPTHLLDGCLEVIVPIFRVHIL